MGKVKMYGIYIYIYIYIICQTGSKKRLPPFLISNLPLANAKSKKQLSKRVQIWVPGGLSHTRYLLGNILLFQKIQQIHFWSSRQVGSFAKSPMTSHKSRSMVQHSTCQCSKLARYDHFWPFASILLLCCYDFKVIFKLRTSRPLQLICASRFSLGIKDIARWARQSQKSRHSLWPQNLKEWKVGVN